MSEKRKNTKSETLDIPLKIMENKIPMKLFSKLSGIAVIGAVIMLSFTECATYVPIKSVRPPTIDTSNIQRLAVRQFENKSGVGGSLNAQITRYMTETAERYIKSAKRFTIVAPTDPNADGVFIGEMRNIVSKDSQNLSERKNKEGKLYIEITYNREVYLEFSYSVISTRTDMPVGTVVKQGSTSSSSSESAAKLTDTLTLAKSIVDSQMRGLVKDLAPTIVSSSRQLLNETSKDKELKQKMKAALSLVKNDNFEEAIRQYDKISVEYGSFAARTNAAILRESIASEAAARDELNSFFNDTNRLADKAVKNAIDALNAKLPSGANIMIIKSNSTDRNMLDYVVDQMTKTVVQAGTLKVVDRSNQVLINAEQQYQLSGNVDDDSTVSIGHQLGVQYIVVCWISGAKSLRRLNQKVLNIETAQIIDQRDFEI
jgi:hypothetical protein